MLEWLKNLIKREPRVAMQPEPVALNPTPNERQKRNASRIQRLEEALQTAKGERRTALLAELRRRQGAN